MIATKTTLNIKIDKDVDVKEKAARLPFQSSVAQTYGNQLLDLIKQKNIPNVTLPTDENGHAYIDKEKHPDLYDWAVNG